MGALVARGRLVRPPQVPIADLANHMDDDVGEPSPRFLGRAVGQSLSHSFDDVVLVVDACPIGGGSDTPAHQRNEGHHRHHLRVLY
jgi:hypothetical protein